jgi:hypothetical protein
MGLTHVTWDRRRSMRARMLGPRLTSRFCSPLSQQIPRKDKDLNRRVEKIMWGG